MKELIGFNLVCLAISSVLVVSTSDGNVREQITAIIMEVLFMGVLSIGFWLMVM